MNVIRILNYLISVFFSRTLTRIKMTQIFRPCGMRKKRSGPMRFRAAILSHSAGPLLSVSIVRRCNVSVTIARHFDGTAWIFQNEKPFGCNSDIDRYRLLFWLCADSSHQFSSRLEVEKDAISIPNASTAHHASPICIYVLYCVAVSESSSGNNSAAQPNS